MIRRSLFAPLVLALAAHGVAQSCPVDPEQGLVNALRGALAEEVVSDQRSTVSDRLRDAGKAWADAADASKEQVATLRGFLRGVHNLSGTPLGAVKRETLQALSDQLKALVGPEAGRLMAEIQTAVFSQFVGQFKAARDQGSSPVNDEPFFYGGRRYGWAVFEGRPIIVPWGSSWRSDWPSGAVRRHGGGGSVPAGHSTGGGSSRGGGSVTSAGGGGSSRGGPVPASQTVQVPPGSSRADAIRAQVAQWAVQQANDPNIGYSQTKGRFGNVSDSRGHRYFDCSGLVYTAYKQFGITLGGSWTGAMQSTWRNWADQVAKDPGAMKPGDLVLMKGHVVMYIGNGRCVGAQTSHTAFQDQVTTNIDVSRYLARSDAIVLRPRV